LRFVDMSGKADHKRPAAGPGSGAVDAEISREIVRIYLEFHGRGPERTKTRRHDDVVVCVLEDVFGTAERILAEAGHFDQVRMNRQAVHEQIAPLMSQVVENATGCDVLASLGQVSADGVAVEVFLLGGSGPVAPA
jgi:uncharacterized protein YbcI